MRCLVSDPAVLGSGRADVQIALAQPGDFTAYRRALRGVKEVFHLQGFLRDVRGMSIEQSNALSAFQMTREAQRAGIERLLLLSALGASPLRRARFLRAKALAEGAVAGSGLDHAILAPSHTYANDDRWYSFAKRIRELPFVPVPAGHQARFEPIAADDVAACAVAALRRLRSGIDCGRRYELAGPEIYDAHEIAQLVLRAVGARGRVVPAPTSAVRRLFRIAARLQGGKSWATIDELDLLLEPLISVRGTADARELGVEPATLLDALGIPAQAP